MKPQLLLLAAIAGSSPVSAQEAPVPAATPTSAPHASTVRALVHQIHEAYDSVKSYRCRMSFQSSDGGPVLGRGDLFFARPNRLKLSLRSAKGSTWIWADGFNVYQQKSPDSYSKTPDSQDVSAIADVLGGFPTYGVSALGGMLSNPDSDDIGPFHIMPSPPEIDRLRAVIPSNSRTVTFQLEFDSATHFLLRAEVTAESGHKKMTEITTFESIRTDLPIPTGTFTFKAPPGQRLLSDQETNALYDVRLKAGSAPFAFSAKDLTGRPQSLAQYKGKVVVLDFWATWCGPCVASMPDMKAVYAKYHKKGLEILGISLDQEKADLTGFLKQNKISWPQVFGGQGWLDPIPKLYGVQGIPLTIVIGRDGRISAIDVRGQQLEAAVTKALKRK